MRVICDTNVWTHIAKGEYIPQVDVVYTPTSFTIFEMCTSGQMIHDREAYRSRVNCILPYIDSAIKLRPLEFVVSSQFEDYKIPPLDFQNMKSFLTADFSTPLTEEEVKELELFNKNQRLPTREFADFSTQNVQEIRGKIKKLVGTQVDKPIVFDTPEDIKRLVKVIIDRELTEYSVDWDKFDWSQIEFFLLVTELYFNCLYDRDGKKVKPNDGVDWLNTFYVRPGDKYLTFDNFWKELILSDERTAKYYFES